MDKTTVFWDVDTQFDFMMPQGSLYVPGAEQIVDKVSEVRRFALENGYSILGDVDWHSQGNPEISDKPDFRQTFPPHCMAGAPGGRRVGYLGELPIEYVEIEPMDDDALRRLIEKDQFHVLITKQSIDAFDNPNTDRLVDLLAPERVAAFGVALDFCVYYVLRGLARHEGIKLVLLKDVTKGLGTRPEKQIYEELRNMGVEIVTFNQFKRRL